MDTEDRIRRFLTNELACGVPAEELTGDYPLLERKVIDSMGIFRVITFLEEDFEIEVLDEELLPDNFATIDAIVNLVDAKRA